MKWGITRANIQLHAWAVSVDNSHYVGIHFFVVAMVGHGHRLGEALCLVVH